MDSQKLNRMGMKRKAPGDDKLKPDKYQHMDAKSPELEIKIIKPKIEILDRSCCKTAIWIYDFPTDLFPLEPKDSFETKVTNMGSVCQEQIGSNCWLQTVRRRMSAPAILAPATLAPATSAPAISAPAIWAPVMSAPDII
uniref:Uncharacterized protein n=1 Tax=Romanomermis culicivorax TaxID=13658 RepID=A0A915JCH6_ROMCU